MHHFQIFFWISQGPRYITLMPPLCMQILLNFTFDTYSYIRLVKIVCFAQFILHSSFFIYVLRGRQTEPFATTYCIGQFITFPTNWKTPSLLLIFVKRFSTPLISHLYLCLS